MPAIKQIVAAVRNQAEVPSFRLLTPFPLDIPFRTRLWTRNSGLVQVSRSFLVGSSPTIHVMALSRYVSALSEARPICSLIFVSIPLLHSRFHFEVSYDEESRHVASVPCKAAHNNQPRTTSTQTTAFGMQSESACHKYSHVRTYQTHRIKVGQNTAVFWPISYSSLSSSEETAPASSWMAWSTVVSDIAFPFSIGFSLSLTSRLSHLLG